MGGELLVLPVGPLRTNVALIGDPARREAVVVDPAIPSLEPLVDALATRGWRLVLALSTHGHWDHTGELAALSAHVRATEGRELEVAVHGLDRPRLERPSPLAAPFPIPASAFRRRGTVLRARARPTSCGQAKSTAMAAGTPTAHLPKG